MLELLTHPTGRAVYVFPHHVVAVTPDTANNPRCSNPGDDRWDDAAGQRQPRADRRGGEQGAGWASA
jgi:hypothetical protein